MWVAALSRSTCERLSGDEGTTRNAVTTMNPILAVTLLM